MKGSFIIFYILLLTMRMSITVLFFPPDYKCLSEINPPYQQTQDRTLQCVMKGMINGQSFVNSEGNECLIREGDQTMPSQNNGWFIKMYSTRTLINVAVSKSTSSSSIYHFSNAPPAGADGNMETMFHSVNEQSPWWKVDLGTSFMVKNIKITARSHQNGRVGDLKVYVSETSPTSTNYSSLPIFAEQIGIPPTASNVYENPGWLCGQYVVVQKQDYNILEFFEFEVHALIY